MRVFGDRSGATGPGTGLRVGVVVALVAAAVMTVTSPLSASGGGSGGRFVPLATFDVMAGNGSSVAEIVDVTDDGNTLIYTDADNEQIGFVDITDPEEPTAGGTLDLPGEPTSLAVNGDYVLVAINTSASFVDPSGTLLVYELETRGLVAELDLGGQPDSTAVSPDGAYAAVVIENERDEDLNDGFLPQLPSGGLVIVDLDGQPTDWTTRPADLSPVAASADNGSDLEPEFVDVNGQNLAVISFQENNHIAVVDLETGATVSEHSAGSAQLDNIDTEDNGLIELTESAVKRREPDAITWLGNVGYATANEGDYEDEQGEEGGSRGFTLFTPDGNVAYESGDSFEHWLISVGHYLDGRSDNKGVEPESIEFARFNQTNYLFVGSERANAVGVYTLSNAGVEPIQVVPTGIGPEGLKAIPERQLLVAATEADEADTGIPTMINIFGLKNNPATAYPTLVSADDDAGLPIPWLALSGLTGDPTDADTLYAVSDSFLAKGFVYTIDVSGPATIVDRLEVVGAPADLDLEGIAVGSDGALWLGSEGNADSRPNLVLKVDPDTGSVLDAIELPADLVDQRRSNGIEGIAVTGPSGAETVYVAIQRAWPDEGDIDGVNTKIGRYDVATGEWGFVHYPLQPEGNGDWIGLSELTLLPNGGFAVIERDKGWGPTTGFVAELKAIYGVDLASAEFRAFDDPAGLVTIDKALLADLLPLLEENSVWTTEKVEGLAVSADGKAFIVTDNDGVDGATGETLFLNLGRSNTVLGL